MIVEYENNQVNNLMNKSTNTFMFMLFIIFQQQIFEKKTKIEKKRKEMRK